MTASHKRTSGQTLMGLKEKEWGLDGRLKDKVTGKD